VRPTLFTLAVPGPGRLSTMARPRGHDWLDDELTGLRSAGVDVLVSALTPPERDELGLTALAPAAGRAGLEFVPVPIPDLSVPELPAVLPTLRALAARLHDGAYVVTHCRAGIGRSSLLAASLLVLNGATPDSAWAAIQEARGLAVPDTPEQRAWTDRLCP